MRRRLPKTAIQKRRIVGMLSILLGMILIVTSVERGVRPVMKQVAESRANSMTTTMINTAVNEQLSKMNLEYQDMVDLERDAQGNILAVRTRMAAVNQFQTEISLAVQSAIDTYGAQKIDIPLGTLTGSALFNNKGPNLPLTITMTGSMSAVITGSFEEAGINQTRHQIVLTVSADANAAVPWYGISTRVEVDFILTETVLVGKVPQSYTYVIDSNGSKADDIFLFGKDSTGASSGNE